MFATGFITSRVTPFAFFLKPFYAGLKFLDYEERVLVIIGFVVPSRHGGVIFQTRVPSISSFAAIQIPPAAKMANRPANMVGGGAGTSREIIAITKTHRKENPHQADAEATNDFTS